jgi:gamma-glutamylcysteine synthetase
MIHIAILVLWTSFKKIDAIEQVNLDFETEEDMKRKFQVGLALQPVRAVW